MQSDDHRIADAKSRDMDQVIEMLGIATLKRFGAERIGPCPQCGGDDRFGVNVRKRMFQCRRCGGKGDAIGLVQFVLGYDFPKALEWLCGPRQELTAEERRARAARDAENTARKAKEEAAFRAKAVAQARDIWQAGQRAEDGPVRDYLACRGITRDLLPRLPTCLRFNPDLAYMVQGQGGDWIEAHRGPAMLAAIQGQDDRFSAVHRTWFDVGAPQGKVSIRHPVSGEGLSRKKSWGSKKGGTIRLIKGTEPVLVMGEGIETTLTAAISGIWPRAHYWAGVDLGNMAGRRETGKGLKFAGIPDLEDDEAFVPPPWVRLLVYVMDGDSDPKLTRAQLEAGLRRAMMLVPGLRGQIARCPVGKDLNDLLMEGVRDD
jgi:CHC2 zinc finger